MDTDKFNVNTPLSTPLPRNNIQTTIIYVYSVLVDLASN